MPHFIGLMSGTSLDGVDVALLDTDGEEIVQLGPTGYRPYTEDERALLEMALKDGAGITDRQARPGRLPEAEALVTTAHAEAVENFLAENGLARESVTVIGFHGQTVVHRPDLRVTVQIGNGAELAARLGVSVVYDFRGGDVAAGGQGAPLVPVFHRAMVARSRLPLPAVVLNLGGVGNLTYIGKEGELIAFDTGPGNALIDDWMRERTGRPFDDGGRTAACGRPDEGILAWLLTHPFFTKPPPKSLDRNAWSHRLVGQSTVENGAATLTAFTARSVVRALGFLPERPGTWIVAGGGARNGEMLRLLRQHLQADIVTADQIGWSSAFLEAQAFAFLAARSLRGLPITFTSTTGVPQPITGGAVARPPPQVITGPS
jgi:anhydro-N-acetylmuramic acid kinase